MKLHVDLRRTCQRMDGFGICQGFGRARILRGSQGLPEERTREVLDLLFGTDGAAFSILRLCIGASDSEGPGRMKSIAPTDPGGPDRPLKYEWDGEDSQQVWLAQEATRYGVRRIFATPLSAPRYMIHRSAEGFDGLLKGMPGTSPESGDWRPTYAEYLLQYVRYYAAHGIRITDLGLVNEPDLLINNPSYRVWYPLLKLEPHQLVDLIKIMGPVIRRSGIPLNMVCSSAMSWDQQVAYTTAIEADEVAAGYVDLHAGDNYQTRARRPLPTTRPTWMSEWDPDVENQTGRWNGSWDGEDGGDGILLAEDVTDALTTADVSGYLYLFGASAREATRALIWLDGPDYRVSKRFWALAAYSRFVRPGAVRVEARVDPPDRDVKVAAFKTPDGGTVANVLNLHAGPADLSLDLADAPEPPVVRRWLTDTDHALTAKPPQRLTDRVVLPGRSLTTLVLDPS